MNLGIIVGSTRPTRIGHLVAQWFHERAVEHGKFDIEQLDLAKFNLPMYDEPKHPSLQQYEHDHTKQWAPRIRATDAFVFVTPEYNSGPPPSLINALSYAYKEWSYKPAGFVSYGGISGGLRAVQIEKQILTTLKIVPLVEAVVVPLVAQSIADGRFRGSELHIQAAKAISNNRSAGPLARQPTPLQRTPPQQPLQMLLSISLSCCWISRSSGVGPADCEAPGCGTVSPVDVR
jgi:NAD(P)H-dependent FMN reductase